MSLEDFARINRSTNEGEPMPRALLEGIYASISRDELKISAGGCAVRPWCRVWGGVLGGLRGRLEATCASISRVELKISAGETPRNASGCRVSLASLRCVLRRPPHLRPHLDRARRVVRRRAALGVLVPAGGGGAPPARPHAAGRQQ